MSKIPVLPGKIKIVLILTLLPFLLLSAQSYSIEELKRNPNYEVKIDADSIAEIYNKQTNLRWMKDIKSYTEPENATDADLIIELDTLNLVYWENLYRQWGELNAANYIGDAKFIVTDANNNGRNEIYAFQTTDTSAYGVLYENLNDSLFVFKSEISDSLAPVYDIGDITNDGLLDIICRGIDNSLRVFRQPGDTSYVRELNFIYHPFPSVYQPNDVTFYDIDNDGVQEIIYYLDAGSLDSIWALSNHVARYNPAINNYELIYYHRPSPHWFTFGFATGDFDNDGKNNFSTGSIDGNYFIYEYVSGNNIQVEYQIQLETLNAFLSVMSEDMNGNGKNEIWVGSDFSSSLYGGVTRVFVLEPDGNGTYQVVYQIDIRGLFSGIYGRIRYVDVDGDGVKEIFLNNGTLVFCFKYSPERKFYLDFIIDTWDNSQDYYEGTDVAGLDSDGVPEFIVQKHHWPPYRTKSLFWKRNKITDVNDIGNTLPEEFNLYQNYPNPFNPSTKISWQSPVGSWQTLKVYDVLGRVVATLVDEYREAGNYEIEFNASNLPSGVYIYKLQAGEFVQNKKMLLTK
ncbi:T9SS type A sorting domain-containing protein [Ignavibacterium sp.]|uniref:T9SS type A sorting domain-containing protein n=1 Tax=Ignavibacterium sp. TaxID=2651167 RepID=UPI00260DA5EF|nr:T9SS type A sorting domain-containing protein [Ignavibacterium sp.]